MPQVKDKQGHNIEVGDVVGTKFRGGKREGEVEAILETEKDVQEQAPDLDMTVKNPPKIVFKDQHGHRVAHNPETLSHVEEDTLSK